MKQLYHCEACGRLSTVFSSYIAASAGKFVCRASECMYSDDEKNDVNDFAARGEDMPGVTK